jgi:uncharacterized protein with PQ loop repeat
MVLIEITGWIASIGFGIAYIPQVYHALKFNTVAGLSIFFLIIFFIADLAYLIYLLSIENDLSETIALIISTVISLISIVVLIFLKLKSIYYSPVKTDDLYF